MTKLHIKPTPGLVVRDPETYEPLAEKGDKKPCIGYWLRRLKDGDVVEIPAVKKGAQ
ncbi:MULTISPECIES: DUF2635 domain-containing protein [Photorhabdus]|uniref:DUF2635 domain-containing protein n=1 Tax=Photorhabdus TaxID=29487 RepID=UPI000ACACBF2|nr:MULTISPECIES: DUF2635 domain-containing protein [Photorhabdus]AXG42209.1 DUF2635 domain-containing protein [Photorhabdus laumondii subsp. laumondii]AXG42443.1 DUF2635 domain-containing protein [Photorhabdus laumondii subsp. laumondii]MCC8387700.1 DUF2635 domain-containing protein [Photorhabdus laumondii]MCZ1247922.1 DUF2635 domain-containing protein [Photorhabdus laumondii subsp. laumondii]NDL15029.1 DUF2635 domain-containing protein [Photorhabdus laumondii subsp. laumondii]